MFASLQVYSLLVNHYWVMNLHMMVDFLILYNGLNIFQDTLNQNEGWSSYIA